MANLEKRLQKFLQEHEELTKKIESYKKIIHPLITRRTQVKRNICKVRFQMRITNEKE